MCLGFVISGCGEQAAGKARRHLVAALSASASSADDDELKATYVALLDASRAKDEAALRRLLAEEYWQTLPDGSVRSKAERIAETVAPDEADTSLEIISFRSMVRGDAGVATAEVLQRGMYKGQPFASRVRSTVVFIRESGRWRIVTTHLSNLADAPAKTAPN
jgi:ketosteroid isomerase-like protein